ncbi:hypothetical protein Tsubulata_004680, partial [Turnera subulata]
HQLSFIERGIIESACLAKKSAVIIAETLCSRKYEHLDKRKTIESTRELISQGTILASAPLTAMISWFCDELPLEGDCRCASS